MINIKNNAKLNDYVYDRNGHQLGFLEKVITIPTRPKEQQLLFCVKKNIYIHTSPRLLFQSNQIFKIANRQVFLDVELDEFESRFSKAFYLRKKIIKQANFTKNDKSKVHESDIIAFDWNELT